MKQYLLQYFDIRQERGQRRLMLHQCRRQPSDNLENLYSELLSLASKAYPSEDSRKIDEAITPVYMFI